MCQETIALKLDIFIIIIILLHFVVDIKCLHELNSTA